MTVCLQLSMEAGEENSGNSLKRQRAPLSDSEDNILLPSGLFVPILSRIWFLISFTGISTYLQQSLQLFIFVTYVFSCNLKLWSYVSEGKDGQKRQRLEAAGQENHSPKHSSSGHHPEPGTKPDTPIVPSVRSRVLQLTQRRGGNPVFTFEAGMLTLCLPNFYQWE